MTGWKVDFLQNAVETCKNPSGEISDCPVFDNHILENHIDGVSNGRCNFEMPEKLEDDHCKGPRDGLCGGVPIQSGPTYATKLTPGLSIQPTATGQPQTTSNTYGGGKSSSNQNLGYSKGTSLLTDNSGSTISGVVAEAFAHAVKTPSPSSEKMVAVSAASSPTPTPIPETTSSEEGDPKAVSTSTYVSGGAEYEIYIEEEYVTTTVTVDSPSKKRRHFHHHRRGHHGGLGGTF